MYFASATLYQLAYAKTGAQPCETAAEVKLWLVVVELREFLGFFTGRVASVISANGKPS